MSVTFLSMVREKGLSYSILLTGEMGADFCTLGLKIVILTLMILLEVRYDRFSGLIYYSDSGRGCERRNFLFQLLFNNLFIDSSH